MSVLGIPEFRAWTLDKMVYCSIKDGVIQRAFSVSVYAEINYVELILVAKILERMNEKMCFKNTKNISLVCKM